MFLLDLNSMDSIVPLFHPSILSFLILLKKERPDPHLPLFHTLDQCHSTTPPHRDAMAVYYLRFDFIVGRTIVHSHHAC
jgi:hypothetical protein